MRMFGPKANPQASNLFAAIQYLQEQEGIHLDVRRQSIWHQPGRFLRETVLPVASPV